MKASTRIADWLVVAGCWLALIVFFTGLYVLDHMRWES